MRRHLSQSIRGALNNWTKKMWDAEAKTRGTSGSALRGKFKLMEFEGKKVVPVGDCDNFDFEKGCLGHPDKDENEGT